MTDSVTEALEWVERRINLLEDSRKAYGGWVTKRMGKEYDVLLTIRACLQKMRKHLTNTKIEELYYARDSLIALKSAYWFINASERELKNIGKSRVCYLSDFHKHAPSLEAIESDIEIVEGMIGDA